MHRQLHRIEEFTLAGTFDGVAQAQAALLHARIFWAWGSHMHIAEKFVQTSINIRKNYFYFYFYFYFYIRRYLSEIQ